MTTNSAFDHSVAAALRDEQTVTTSGRRIEDVIHGVRTQAPVVHNDHRGRVFEIFAGEGDYWQDPVVYCYAFSIRVNQVKGWGLHLEKTDRYTLLRGENMTVMYDARLDSPTHGLVQRVYLSEQGVRQLTIPAGVWHMNVNIGETEAMLINHPTEVYHHERPDRLLLAWDSEEIPVDLAGLFPVQMHGPASRDCS